MVFIRKKHVSITGSLDNKNVSICFVCLSNLSVPDFILFIKQAMLSAGKMASITGIISSLHSFPQASKGCNH
jgi:hypothetical protein